MRKRIFFPLAVTRTPIEAGAFSLGVAEIFMPIEININFN
jgi:hypothetical protein